MSPAPPSSGPSFFGIRLATALSEALRQGYAGADLRADLLAGLVVGAVALPLSMALAIASGVPPQHGLYTAIVAGALIALLGGSRLQVSGPTAAFVVILVPISTRFGLGGLLLATLMAGLILILMGLSHFGRLMEFVPYPVTAGFTAGIGVVIATLQVKDLLGLTVTALPEHYVDRVVVLARALPTTRLADLGIGLLTLAVLLFWPRVSRQVPAPLVALTVGALAAAVLARFWPELAVADLKSRFSYVVDGVTHRGVPSLPPLPGLPWNLPGPDGAPLQVTWSLLRDLVPSAFAIAMLGAIESLLSAVVADGMAHTRHDPDAELTAQGLGNLVAPFFGGIAATGAIARTATNIRSGGRSPLAALFHSLFVLAAVLLLGPLLGYLPMASLAALLLLVAWNMSELPHFLRASRIAPRSDTVVLWTCFGLTVVFDMVIAVSVGVVLASLLFMRRMAEVAHVRLIGEHHEIPGEEGPKEALRDPRMLVYEVAGPLFFGAVQRSMRALDTVGASVQVLLLDLRSVPAMDATALVNLESALARLHHHNVLVVLAGVQRQPLRALLRAGLRNRPGRLLIRRSYHRGLDAARRHLAGAC